MIGLVNAESFAYVLSVILSFKSTKVGIRLTSQVNLDQKKLIFFANFAKIDRLLKSVVVHR